tara:strand:+ start:1853 stop:2989 length:1137 start_codon:yes stop_codon:yes gene_type:complete
MYNIHSHYENIFHYLNSIIADPILLYLHPFGATQPENIEVIMADRPDLSREDRGPIFLCYDQEPLLPDYNRELFESIKERWDAPYILLNTERDSESKKYILREHSMLDVNYFFHGLCASDWYRGYFYDKRITDPSKRTIKKSYVTLNRITSGERVYRIIFVAKLIEKGLDKSGMISFSDVCVDSGKHALAELHLYGLEHNINTSPLVAALASAELPMRFDTPDDKVIPNGSHVLGPIDKFMECAFFVVTETCFWDRKTHLTEKIFKPIVMKMPFILLGPAHNLQYLRSYGFKTFGAWIDESYDDIEDNMERIDAVVQVLFNLQTQDLEKMLVEMESILEHNYNLFYSKEFSNGVWTEMTDNIKSSLQQAGVPLLPQKP